MSKNWERYVLVYTSEKKLALSSLQHTFKQMKTAIQVSIFAGPNKSSCLSLLLQVMCSNCLITLKDNYIEYYF